MSLHRLLIFVFVPALIAAQFALKMEHGLPRADPGSRIDSLYVGGMT